MKQKLMRGVAALLCAAVLLSALPVAAGADSVTGFPDVPENAWYVKYLGKIIEVQAMMHVNNIIGGYPDGTFKPQREVTRGEFLKMIFEAAQSSGNQISLTVNEEQRKAHWAGKYYTMAEADNILVADPYASGKGVELMFPCTYDELNKPMTRYEMAVVLNNVCRNIAMQKTVNVLEPEKHITDYAQIPTQYVTAVEQMYGKGLLTGDENAYFLGDDTLTRAQAATVLYRFLFVDTIKGDGLQDWASYSVVKSSGSYMLVDEHGNPDPSKSFANWLNNGHVNAWGQIDAEAKIKLFGNAYTSYFASSYQAAPYIETVSVPIWTLDKSGQKVASTVGIQVNKAVAAEVHDIFQTIFDDPEQFPIYGGWSAGGARYTDTMRHSWGCAIDVNALYNCECNFRAGYQTVTCGYGWWPGDIQTWAGRNIYAYHGSMTGASPYSIHPTSSVVRAFAAYGWGWGGSGTNVVGSGNGWGNGMSYDFMHFSVLPSGG